MPEDHVSTYGVSRQTSVASELDAQVEEIDRLGFTVVESGWSQQKLEALRASVDRVYQRQVNEVGLEFLAQCNEADIARIPMVYDDVFLELATFPPLMDICRRIFGANYVLLQENAIINRAGSEQTQGRWHRDLAYQHFVLEGTHKMCINALFCLDPFRPETGGTWLLPGSHKFVDFPSTAFVQKHRVMVDVPAGSILVMDAMCYHRSGINTSNVTRRGVNYLIGSPLLVPQFDLPRIFGDTFEQDPFLSNYFGYRWNPKPSAAAWRRLRQK